MLQKMLGGTTSSMSGVMDIIAITSFVQLCLGLAGLWHLKGETTSDMKGKIGAILFGAGAIVCNICALAAFQLDGSVIVVTFISTLSIIPGAFIDRFRFNHHLNRRQWTGIGLGVIAGYAILGFPSLAEAMAFPLWIWLAFGNMAGLAVNQWIVQEIKEIHPYAQNVWGGGSMLISSLAILFFIGPLSIVTNSSATFIGASLAIGVITFFMWAFSLFAYKKGAFISLKKLIMNGSYLAMIVAVGIAFFGEQITFSHFAGFALYLTALIFVDQKTWETVKAFFFNNRRRQR